MNKQQIILAENMEKDGTNKKAAHYSQTNGKLPVYVEFPPPLTKAFGNDGLENPPTKSSQRIHKRIPIGFFSISLPKNLIKDKPLLGGYIAFLCPGIYKQCRKAGF